ncbi:MAG: trypsin-like peptidase domain-containing protein [Actinobacteria bacterium]|nr:trypsin-like peptidase domain-containing protein [Actinomycetota bacterium]
METPLRLRPLILLAAAAFFIGACDIGAPESGGGSQGASGSAGSSSGGSAPKTGGESNGAEDSGADAAGVDEASAATTTADVVERVLPSVVNVRTTTAPVDSFGAEGRGQGSGVVIDKGGLILTNNHVIEGAVDVNVVFNDNHDSMQGHVIAALPERDLAVIEVNAHGLSAIETGSSDTLRLGDDVIAIGYPLGLGGPTVTKGIVSAKNRTIEPQGGEHLEGLLQTDAAINPGNSGGALVDASGRLVGINTAAASAGFAENLGFAISIDGALPVVEEVINDPPEEQAWLGVYLQDVDPATADQLGLDPDTRGALIADVIAGGPAQRAGIEQGDVIVSLGDDRIEGANELTEALRELDPGDRADVGLVGGGGQRTLRVELGRRPVPTPN